MAATVELPEHLQDSGEWKDWPRKLDAHVQWGVRLRQVDAYIRNGRIKVYVCPDGSRRIEPDAMRELFGEPGVVQGRDRNISAAERQRRQAEVGACLDPTVLMFGKAVGMMTDLHTQLLGQLKLVSEPLQVLLGAYSKTTEAQAKRITELEAQVDASRRLHSELEDSALERDILLKRHESSERRRDQTLSLLKEQLPALMKTWLEGDSLAAFAKRAPKDVVQAIVESETISEQDSETLRRAAGIPKPAPQPPTPQPNGAASHGH